MSSPKFVLGVLAWLLGLAACVVVARLSDCNGVKIDGVNWIQVGAGVAVFCFAFGLSRLLTATKGPIEVDLGETKFDALRYDNRLSAAALFGGFCLPLVVKLAFGDYSSHHNIIGYVLTQSLFAFLILGNPWRVRLRFPRAGFAIHERGIRVEDRSIKFDDIVSVSPHSVEPRAFAVELGEEIVGLVGDVNDRQFEKARTLLRQKCKVEA